ncbi:MAG TPA: YhfC family glutamic-type intramembrane protease, partial [Bacillales bacterium]|nr:YhfC family glutamic-type intramembrane protease [Bacillales bacterium]
GLSFIQSILFSFMINSGGFAHLLTASGGGEAADSLEKIKDQLVGTPSYEFLLGGFERIFAFVLQLGLSMLVLYAVKTRRLVFLVYAILIHAVVDFLAVMSGYWKINAFVTEGFLCIIAILSVVYLTVTYKREKEQTNPISE